MDPDAEHQLGSAGKETKTGLPNQRAINFKGQAGRTKGIAAMDALRKSGKDRRSGVDRRIQLLPGYHGADRRGKPERRLRMDRRDNVMMSERSHPRKPTLIEFLFGRKDKSERNGESPKLRSGPSPAVTFVDEGGIVPRSHKRLPCEVPVQILDRDTHSFHPAIAHNYCHPGMYLVSKHAPRVGSGLMIDVANHSSPSDGPDNVSRYYSKVVWLKKLSGNVVFLQYGMGVKHCRDLNEFLKLFGL